VRLIGLALSGRAQEPMQPVLFAEMEITNGREPSSRNGYSAPAD
jgi:hypothetical protein